MKRTVTTPAEGNIPRASSGRLLEVSTLLNCTPERAYEEVQRPQLLEYVAAPLIRFEPLEPRQFPERWQEGKYLVRMWFFGIIPVGTQWVGLEKPLTTAPHYAIRDNGHGQLMRVWDHLITIAPTADGKTRYTDRIEVNAGILTPFAWVFAYLFYHHRQRRWRGLVARGFRYEEQ